MKTLLITEQQMDSIYYLLNEGKRKDNPQMSAGVLPIAKSTGRILIHKRGPKINSPNQWCNYGGGSYIGESQRDCAKREFREESGYKGYVDLIRSYTFTKAGGFKFQNFIGIVDREFKPKINVKTVDGHVEASDYKWLTFEELKKFRGKLHKGFEKLLKEREKQIADIIKTRTKAGK
jgi:ADP-ribose pyrophosphatase YjhB (NUDIX family)